MDREHQAPLRTRNQNEQRETGQNTLKPHYKLLQARMDCIPKSQHFSWVTGKFITNIGGQWEPEANQNL
jgi:hypothetical protein